MVMRPLLPLEQSLTVGVELIRKSHRHIYIYSPHPERFILLVWERIQRQSSVNSLNQKASLSSISASDRSLMMDFARGKMMRDSRY